MVSACEPTAPIDDGLGLGDSRQADAVVIDSVSVGSATTCMTAAVGSAKCWGHNGKGQLGRGDTLDIGDDELPEATGFIDLGAQAQQVVTNGRQTYALLEGGTIRAWGSNDGFELGLQHEQTLGDDETPATSKLATDVDLGGAAVEIAAGGGFACARLVNGTVRCWGSNDYGQLGRGDVEPIGDDEPPSQGLAVFFGTPAVQLVAGEHHACVRLGDGTVRCWGRGAQGQLGYASSQNVGDDEFPVSAGSVDVGGPVAQLVAGGNHTCALRTDGDVICWGRGAEGQLGYGDQKNVGDEQTPASAGPVPVGAAVVSLAAGAEHTCGLLGTGALRCWGSAAFGQLGYGNTEAIGDGELAGDGGDLDLGGHDALAVYAGFSSRSTCALLDDLELRCWGDNQFGQLGYGHTSGLGDDVAERPGDLPYIVLIEDNDA